MIVGGKHSLQKFKGMRLFLCNLASDGKLDQLKQEYKEVNSFLKIRKIMGDNCDYLLSLCKVMYENESLIESLEYDDDDGQRFI